MCAVYKHHVHFRFTSSCDRPVSCPTHFRDSRARGYMVCARTIGWCSRGCQNCFSPVIDHGFRSIQKQSVNTAVGGRLVHDCTYCTRSVVANHRNTSSRVPETVSVASSPRVHYTTWYIASYIVCIDSGQTAGQALRVPSDWLDHKQGINLPTLLSISLCAIIVIIIHFSSVFSTLLEEVNRIDLLRTVNGGDRVTDMQIGYGLMVSF